MDKFWDKILKLLAKRHPGHFVQFLFKDEASYIGECNHELQVQTLQTDILYNVTINGKEAILHIELQRKRDDKMSQRMWRYNVGATLVLDKPVYSYVVYLVRDGMVEEPPYTFVGPDGKTLHTFQFENVKLWEVDAEQLKQPGLEGLLPLLPLSRGGTQRETIEEMFQRLEALGQADLLAYGSAIAIKMAKRSKNLEWLRRRVLIMDQETIEFLRETDLWDLFREWALKEAKEELKQGPRLEEFRKLQGLCYTLTYFVDRRFPTLSALAQRATNYSRNLDELQKLTDAVFDAQTIEVAQTVLEGAVEKNQREWKIIEDAVRRREPEED